MPCLGHCVALLGVYAAHYRPTIACVIVRPTTTRAAVGAEVWAAPRSGVPKVRCCPGLGESDEERIIIVPGNLSLC
ncbi:hypothetical protein F5B21DRAFT_471829, partial [Xylaria acuta]